jgi:hypothetical protein
MDQAAGGRQGWWPTNGYLPLPLVCKTGVMDVALLRPAVVYDLLLEVWHVLAAEILSYSPMLNRPVRVEAMIIHA